MGVRNNLLVCVKLEIESISVVTIAVYKVKYSLFIYATLYRL